MKKVLMGLIIGVFIFSLVLGVYAESEKMTSPTIKALHNASQTNSTKSEVRPPMNFTRPEPHKINSTNRPPMNFTKPRELNESDHKIIGGDKDPHGCLGPAGYSWNESEKNCVREWENGTKRYQGDMGIGQELRDEIKERKQEFREGNYTGPQGQYMQVKMLGQELRELMGKNFTAKTDLNITLINENGSMKLKIELENGTEKEINIMPDMASEKAFEKLKLKRCNETNNCTFELKDVGKGKIKKLAYELQVERHAKILGLFSAKSVEKAQIDPETGEVILVKKPWWSFFATKSD
ncbi:Uncharacterised protein [uncultured archaeon]|nr:Uncharacterised protein [uncultured archaeon]